MSTNLDTPRASVGRAALLLIGALLLLSGPVYHQLLGGKREIGVSWRMFGAKAVGLHVARVSVAAPGGAFEVADASALLPTRLPPTSPLRLNTSKRALEQVRSQLCEGLSPDHQVQVEVLVAGRAGWAVEKTLSGACRDTSPRETMGVVDKKERTP